MDDRMENGHTPFDERAALEELERLRQNIETYRARRRGVSASVTAAVTVPPDRLEAGVTTPVPVLDVSVPPSVLTPRAEAITPLPPANPVGPAAPPSPVPIAPVPIPSFTSA
ncbi:MAG: hypothetical protein H0W08_26900, partial [Acidobacteria bacterium]|nr:hypothetical protein [Acidobacteriota bacterium]